MNVLVALILAILVAKIPVSDKQGVEPEQPLFVDAKTSPTTVLPTVVTFTVMLVAAAPTAVKVPPVDVIVELSGFKQPSCEELPVVQFIVVPEKVKVEPKVISEGEAYPLVGSPSIV